MGSNLQTSATMLIQALNLIAFVPTLYAKFYLNVSQDVFAMETVFSGLPNAMALTFLIWIYFFTAAHEKEEGQLAALLMSAVAPDGDSPLGEETAEAFENAAIPEPDTEF